MSTCVELMALPPSLSAISQWFDHLPLVVFFFLKKTIKTRNSNVIGASPRGNSMCV
eukprot:SAG11_NODE_2378_length_3435_cov_4.530576_1_plen_56_part_00